MEDGRITDSQITASSEYVDAMYHGPTNARLNKPAESGVASGSWAAQTMDTNQWIQVDLKIATWVTGVMIQGRAGTNQWVKKFKVQYSDDGEKWKYIRTADYQGEQVNVRKSKECVSDCKFDTFYLLKSPLF